MVGRDPAGDDGAHLLLCAHSVHSISYGNPILVRVVLHRVAEPGIVAAAPYGVAGRSDGP